MSTYGSLSSRSVDEEEALVREKTDLSPKKKDSSYPNLFTAASRSVVVFLICAAVAVFGVSFSRNYLNPDSNFNSAFVTTSSTDSSSDSSRVTYAVLTEQQKEAIFEQFLLLYKRTYINDKTEYAKRFTIFKTNLDLCDVRNAQEAAVNGTAVHGVTKFADLSTEEFASVYLMDGYEYDVEDDEDEDEEDETTEDEEEDEEEEEEEDTSSEDVSEDEVEEYSASTNSTTSTNSTSTDDYYVSSSNSTSGNSTISDDYYVAVGNTTVTTDDTYYSVTNSTTTDDTYYSVSNVTTNANTTTITDDTYYVVSVNGTSNSTVTTDDGYYTAVNVTSNVNTTTTDDAYYYTNNSNNTAVNGTSTDDVYYINNNNSTSSNTTVITSTDDIASNSTVITTNTTDSTSDEEEEVERIRKLRANVARIMGIKLPEIRKAKRNLKGSSIHGRSASKKKSIAKKSSTTTTTTTRSLEEEKHGYGDPTLIYLDWTTKYTTSVRDMGECSGSWAAAVVEQVESDAIRSGMINSAQPLSVQQLLACTGVSEYPCRSGDVEDALEYIRKPGGIYFESDYAYTSDDGNVAQCSDPEDTVFALTTGGYFSLNTDGNTYNSERMMVAHLTSVGPVGTCIDGSMLSTYVSGTISNCIATSINHCVQVVGLFYSSATDSGFYKVRNSWGSDWGVNGYVSIAYGDDVCGITSEPFYTDPVRG